MSVITSTVTRHRIDPGRIVLDWERQASKGICLWHCTSRVVGRFQVPASWLDSNTPVQTPEHRVWTEEVGLTGKGELCQDCATAAIRRFAKKLHDLRQEKKDERGRTSSPDARSRR